MAEKLPVSLIGNIVPKCIGDISILLIDNDATSVASLIPMLKQASHKVMSVDVASEAVSIIEKQKDIGLVIANVELPHVDSHSFLMAMHHKEIPLILIGPETNIKEASDLLTKRACYCLKKPFSENDINNMLQHVVAPNKRQELEKINIDETRDSVVEERMKQMEAFRQNIRRQGSFQSSLLGRRPFTSSVMYQKRKCIENVFTVERRKNLWNRDRHMKFVAAIGILGEKECRPKAILEIMNDSNLSLRQIASHLQKYKYQVERISKTLSRNECKSTDKTFEHPSDYVYPFKASNLKKNLIESNSMWYSLRKEPCSSSSTVQYSFKRAAAEKKDKMPMFDQGETSYLHSYSLSGLPSSVGASNLDAFQKEATEISISESYPNPSQSSNPVLETNRNPLDCVPPYVPESNVPQAGLCTMGSVSLGESHLGLFSGEASHEAALETDTNQMDWDWMFTEEAFAILEDMASPETNVTQVGLVPGETSSAALDNVAPPENNMNEMGLVPYQEGNDIPIEDLISFDFDNNDLDLDAFLENYDASQRDVPLPSSFIGHDHSLGMHLESTSQHQNIEAENPREAVEGGNHLDDDSDQNMDWIDDILNNIA